MQKYVPMVKQNVMLYLRKTKNLSEEKEGMVERGEERGLRKGAERG